MTTSSITPVPRTTDPICPSWCTGHGADSYQTWHLLDADGESPTPARHHDGRGAFVNGLGVYLVQQETPTGVGPAKVWVTENDHDPDTHQLTPPQARELAAAIVAAADRIDAEAA